MTSLIATLIVIAFVAIPIAIVVKVVRRLQQMTRGLSDPARLQRAFAEHAATALRRAGADPQSIAKLDVLRQPPATDRVVEPVRALPRAPRSPRPRPRPSQPLLGLDMGDSFRLAQPPDQGEPQAPFGISNWVVMALLVGAAAYFLLR